MSPDEFSLTKPGDVIPRHLMNVLERSDLSRERMPEDELIANLELFGLDGHASFSKFQDKLDALDGRHDENDLCREILSKAAMKLSIQYGLGVLPLEKGRWQKSYERFCAQFGMLGMTFSTAVMVKGGEKFLGFSPRGGVRLCLKDGWHKDRPYIKDGEVWILAGGGADLHEQLDDLCSQLADVTGTRYQIDAVRDALARVLPIYAHLFPMGYLSLRVPLKFKNGVFLTDTESVIRPTVFSFFAGILGNLGKQVKGDWDLGGTGFFLVDFPVVEFSPSQQICFDNPTMVALTGPQLHYPSPIKWLAKAIGVPVEVSGDVFAYREDHCSWHEFRDRKKKCSGVLRAIRSLLPDELSKGQPPRLS